MTKEIIFVGIATVLFSACAGTSGTDNQQSSTDSEEEAQQSATAQVVDYSEPDLPEEFQGQSPPSGAAGSFSTDFSRATVSFDQIISGGPPKDGIPSIDDPEFVSTDAADEWLSPGESVLVVTTGSGDERETHIYPVQILMFHEIVNDTVGGRPVTATYCPLCNTGIAFDRRFDRRTLDFGTTGRLRHSNLIMYDRQTETWWQQATGKGVAGRYAGGELEMIPMLTLSWSDAKSDHPDADVLSRETGHTRSYGRNPYANYDSGRPFLYRGPTDDEFEPMTRVVAVFHEGSSEAFPYPELREKRAAETTISGDDIVVFWEPGTASPLDSSSVAQGRDVGTANAFFARADGRTLSFTLENGDIVDAETGSTWDVTGTATSGPLEGTELEPVTTSQHFWFSWTAFRSESDS